MNTRVAALIVAVSVLSGCSLPLGFPWFPGFPQQGTATLSAAHTGTLCANGVAASGVQAVAGDFEATGNPCGGSYAVAAFVAFRVPPELKRQGVSLMSAVFSGQRQTLQGNPYTAPTGLLVEAVPYLDDGALNGADWDAPSLSGNTTVATSPASEGAPVEFRAEPFVAPQLSREYIGFRFRFQWGPDTRAPSGNGSNDLERIIPGTLTINYMAPP